MLVVVEESTDNQKVGIDLPVKKGGELDQW